MHHQRLLMPATLSCPNVTNSLQVTGSRGFQTQKLHKELSSIPYMKTEIHISNLMSAKFPLNNNNLIYFSIVCQSRWNYTTTVNILIWVTASQCHWWRFPEQNNTQFVTNYGTTCTVHVFEALTIPYCIGIQDSLNYLACVGLEPSSAWIAECKGLQKGGGGGHIMLY